MHREVSAIDCVRLSTGLCRRNNGRFVRLKNQRDALIQFTYMLVDALGIYLANSCKSY